MQPLQFYIDYTNNNTTNKMTKIKYILFLICSLTTINFYAQEDNGDYIEFNDRKNIVHGVYIGLNLNYGEINNEDTYIAGLKIAYVANRKFEIGLQTTAFYSEQNFTGLLSTNEDLVGVYTGIHLEPIFFSESLINLSFPVLIGGGAAKYIDGNIVERDNDVEIDFDENEKDWDDFFVLEPGISLLFNINRYVQIEAGIKYRFSSRMAINPSNVNRIDGFSTGIGLKVGVFNLGRNRYKKHLKDGKK